MYIVGSIYIKREPLLCWLKKIWVMKWDLGLKIWLLR